MAKEHTMLWLLLLGGGALLLMKGQSAQAAGAGSPAASGAGSSPYAPATGQGGGIGGFLSNLFGGGQQSGGGGANVGGGGILGNAGNVGQYMINQPNQTAAELMPVAYTPGVTNMTAFGGAGTAGAQAYYSPVAGGPTPGQLV